MNEGDTFFKLREELHKQYEYVIDLYKFYWTISLQISGFYVVSIGSVLSFYSAHITSSQDEIKWVLPFCAFLSLVFSFLALYGTVAAQDLSDWFEALGAESRLDLDYWASSQPLQVYLILNSFLGFVVGNFCAYLFYKAFIGIYIYILTTLILAPFAFERGRGWALSLFKKNRDLIG